MAQFDVLSSFFLILNLLLVLYIYYTYNIINIKIMKYKKFDRINLFLLTLFCFLLFGSLFILFNNFMGLLCFNDQLDHLINFFLFCSNRNNYNEFLRKLKLWFTPYSKLQPKQLSMLEREAEAKDLQIRSFNNKFFKSPRRGFYSIQGLSQKILQQRKILRTVISKYLQKKDLIPQLFLTKGVEGQKTFSRKFLEKFSPEATLKNEKLLFAKGFKKIMEAKARSSKYITRGTSSYHIKRFSVSLMKFLSKSVTFLEFLIDQNIVFPWDLILKKKNLNEFGEFVLKQVKKRSNSYFLLLVQIFEFSYLKKPYNLNKNTQMNVFINSFDLVLQDFFPLVYNSLQNMNFKIQLPTKLEFCSAATAAVNNINIKSLFFDIKYSWLSQLFHFIFKLIILFTSTELDLVDTTTVRVDSEKYKVNIIYSNKKLKSKLNLFGFKIGKLPKFTSSSSVKWQSRLLENNSIIFSKRTTRSLLIGQHKVFKVDQFAQNLLLQLIEANHSFPKEKSVRLQLSKQFKFLRGHERHVLAPKLRNIINSIKFAKSKHRNNKNVKLVVNKLELLFKKKKYVSLINIIKKLILMQEGAQVPKEEGLELASLLLKKNLKKRVLITASSVFKKYLIDRENYQKFLKKYQEYRMSIAVAESCKGYPLHYNSFVDFRLRMYPQEYYLSRITGITKHLLCDFKNERLSLGGFRCLMEAYYAFSREFLTKWQINISNNTLKSRKDFKKFFLAHNYETHRSKFIFPFKKSVYFLSLHNLLMTLAQNKKSNKETTNFLVEIDQVGSGFTIFALFIKNAALAKVSNLLGGDPQDLYKYLQTEKLKSYLLQEGVESNTRVINFLLEDRNAMKKISTSWMYGEQNKSRFSSLIELFNSYLADNKIVASITPEEEQYLEWFADNFTDFIENSFPFSNGAKLSDATDLLKKVVRIRAKAVEGTDLPVVRIKTLDDSILCWGQEITNESEWSPKKYRVLNPITGNGSEIRLYIPIPEFSNEDIKKLENSILTHLIQSSDGAIMREIQCRVYDKNPTSKNGRYIIGSNHDAVLSNASIVPSIFEVIHEIYTGEFFENFADRIFFTPMKVGLDKKTVKKINKIQEQFHKLSDNFHITKNSFIPENAYWYEGTVSRKELYDAMKQYQNN